MMTYASRTLLSDGIGRVSSAQNIAQYFVLIAALGIPTYGVKKVAACCGKKQDINKVFSELFFLNLCSTMACSLSYFLMIYILPFFREQLSLYLAAGLIIIFNAFNVDWYYQGTEEFRYIMYRSLAVKILSLVALFTFVHTEDDFVAYAIVLSMSKVSNYLFNIIHVRKRVSISIKNIDMIQHIKPVVILLAASVAVEVYTLADTTMLTFLCGESIVGYYSTAVKSISVLRTLIVAVCAVFLPRLSLYYAQNEMRKFKELILRGFKILLTFTIPAATGCYLLSKNMIFLMFGTTFEGAVQTLQILSISIITVAISNFIGYQILITIGKEKIMFLSTVIGAAVNVCLNLFFIPILQHNGAAIASVITEGTVAIIQLIAVRKIVDFKSLIRTTILPIIGSSIIMYVTVNIVVHVFSSNLLVVIIGGIMGVGSYCGGSILLRNDLVPIIRSLYQKEICS